jgi:hypothetical protein
MKLVRMDSRLCPQGRGEGSSWEGEEENECVRVEAGLHPCGRTNASADGKNPSVGKIASAG